MTSLLFSFFVGLCPTAVTYCTMRPIQIDLSRINSRNDRTVTVVEQLDRDYRMAEPLPIKYSLYDDITMERYNIIKNFASNIIENSQNIDPKYIKLINDHFWDLA